MSEQENLCQVAKELEEIKKRSGNIKAIKLIVKSSNKRSLK